MHLQLTMGTVGSSFHYDSIFLSESSNMCRSSAPFDKEECGCLRENQLSECYGSTKQCPGIESGSV